MKTRSQTINNEKQEFNFDEATYEWVQNKKKMTNGCYVYICNYPLSNGKLCQKNSVLNHNICSYEYCSQHQKYYVNK